MAFGNYDAGLEKCCEDMFKEFKFADMINLKDLDKREFKTCSACQTVVWYELKDVMESHSDSEPFITKVNLYVRTNVK